ncbi:MAG: DUF1569 domain-containing protein [Planctomycetales bacterium]|nr:DUF1569 domain-containing protein [Planctomycetales bacterium]
MAVNTKAVKGRRSVRYESYGELLADAQQLAASNVKTLGNWSLGQILKHVADSIDTSVDGAGFSLPAPVRWLMTILMKNKFLYRELPPGFNSSKQFIPGETSVEEGIRALRQAIDRQSSEAHRARHPAFGKISKDEWTAFNLRHAEMHMSFVKATS